MKEYAKHVRFDGRLLILGFGSVGQGVLPLLLRHLDIAPRNIVIITAEPRGRGEAAHYGISFREFPLTPENYRPFLNETLRPGDFLLNVSVNVSSVALLEYCQQHGILYLDTCIEPWAGGYADPSLTPSQRSNYGLRESVLALRGRFPDGPTAIPTHGANPGLVSHFVKQALLDIARDAGHRLETPQDRHAWAALAQTLGIKVIHIAERDTQVADPPKQIGEFVNTWSVDGFIGEGMQPAEIGWGSHERHFPADGARHDFGSGAAIYLCRPGASVRVRSWTPLEGPYQGFLITHAESISIADYLTVRREGQVRYRPTVHYAYHPCDAAVLSVHELTGKNWKPQERQRVLLEDISGGMDELGVLLMGHAKGGYWYGSRLTVEAARKLAPYNNATSLQVAAGIMAAMVWAIRHPRAGIVEPDELPFDSILELARPYLGSLIGQYGHWTPLQDRGQPFPEVLDTTDPWQFKNFRVE